MCGSRDLSTPQPKVSLWWKLAAAALRFLIGIFVVALLVLVGLAILAHLLQDSQFQGALVVLVILFSLLWWLWTELPQCLRSVIRRALRRKERGDER